MLARVAEGNEPAFAQLVSLYWYKTFVYALKFLKSSHTAEEFTQDIFIKVWNNRQRLTDVRHFPDYLFIVTRNELISQLRRKVIRVESISPDLQTEDTLSPEKRTEGRSLAALLEKGVQDLPPQQKKVYRMVTYDHMSYEDISLEMGISKRTVRFHMASALSYLRTFIRYSIFF